MNLDHSNRRTMRAARIVAPRRVEIDEIAMPEPGAGEVRIQVDGCGVCGSNLPLWRGRSWFHYPIEHGAPGHEGWGRVDQLGAEVDSVRPGERVAFLSNRAYAEYDIARADSLVRVPAITEIFPGEALGCAMNIFRRCGIEPEQTVAVVGIGFLGALLIQLAVAAGAQVLAISRRPFALQVARRYGAAEALASSDPTAVIARVMERTDGSGCPCVIEAAGEQATLDLASELVSVRGRLVIAGYHQDSPRRVNMQLWNWRGIDVINAHERDPRRYVAGMKAAAERVAQGALETESLYTHGFPLENINAAFTALDERPEGFLKSWIQPRPNQASVQE
ncbi:MAG: tdh [Deltaproteobacteria bacterium]|jgi:threonine dehydrogenase-like Zn-dependent dehydrogenase|nr:tdh [Deltaproteobacteria bacterium]